MIFDTHAHYYDEAFDADRDALLASLPGRGVALVVCPGCDPESSRQSIALAERYGFLYAAAGYHPENLEGAALSDLDAVRALCAHPKVVAVGEIGLDYYWLKTPEEYCAVTKPRQGMQAWDAMLDFARECKEYVPHVVMTIVDKDKTPEEITRCRRLTEDLGVTLRIRAYIPD